MFTDVRKLAPASPGCVALNLIPNLNSIVRTQRYISTRAMFTDVRELAPASPGGAAADAAGAQAALRNLGTLFKGLLSACREDALVMEQARAVPFIKYIL